MSKDFNYQERDDTVNLSKELYDVTTKHPFSLLTTGVGSGKTYVVIRTIYMIDPTAFILLIAPLSKIKEDSWAPSVDAFNQTMGSDLKLFGTNYDQLLSKKGEKHISNALESALSDNRKVIIVYDEAHVIKLSSSGKISQTAKKAIQLSQLNIIHKTIGATGTPLANSYVDYGTYFIMAGFYKTKTQYLNEQILSWDDYHAPLVKNRYTGEIDRQLFRDPDKIERLQNDITVYAETDHLLPPASSHQIDFDIDDSTTFVDEQLSTEFTTAEATPKTRRGHYNHVQKMLRKGGYFEFPITGINIMRRLMAEDPMRLKACARVLYNKLYGKKPHPVIIFYLNNAERDTLTNFITTNQYFKHVELRYVNGSRKDDLTPNHPQTIYLIQYKAGSSAIEIPEAKTSIFYMPTYSYADFKQAKGRNRRNINSARNTNETIHYYQLSANKSLDQRIWQTLDAKRDFSNNAIETWLYQQKDWTHAT